MKTKVFHFTGTLLVVAASFLVTCDPFQEDVNPSIPLDKISTEYFTLPNSSTIIDLKPVASTSYTKATLRITKSSERGELILLDELLLKYRPFVDFTGGEDQLIVEFIKGNMILLRINISIYVVENFSQLPCGVASEDLVCVTSASEPILFLKNDKTCSGSSVETSIYINPLHGKAIIHADTVIYTPSDGYKGPDQFVYKLVSKGDSITTSYGVVTIPTPSVIQFNETNMLAPEGKDVTVPILFNKPIACTDSISVSISGTALYDKLYTTEPPALDGVIKIPVAKGQSSAYFKLKSIDDDLLEINKSAIFTIAPPTAEVFVLGALKTKAVTFEDNEKPSLAEFVSSQGSIKEDNGNGVVAPIYLSSPTKGEGSITLFINPGKAKYGTDFITTPAAKNDSITISVPKNATSTSFQITPIDNKILSANSPVVFSISKTSGVVHPGVALNYTLTILEDEVYTQAGFVKTHENCDYYYGYGCYAVSSGSVAENQSSGIVVPIQFSAKASGIGTIKVSLINWSSNCDFNAKYGTAFTTSPAPETNGSIVIPVSYGDEGASFTVFPMNNDLFTEGAFLTFQITSGDGVIQVGSLDIYSLNIQDDEIPSIFKVTGNTKIEENDGDGQLIVLPFSAPTGGPATVNVRFNWSNTISFRTEPALSSDNTLTWNVGQNESGVSFKVFPIDNAFCNNLFVTFYPITTCGWVKADNTSVGSFTIIDDEASQGSFQETSGTVSEDNTTGILVKLNFNKPLPENSSVIISSGDCNQPFLTEPPTVCFEGYYYGPPSQALTINLLKGAVSAQFKIFPVNNNEKGNHTVNFIPLNNNCLQFDSNVKYTLTIIDDD